MDDNELEYRIPAKVLTNRDPILLGKLSIREFFQWAFFFVLVYVAFNLLPFIFTIKLVMAAIVVVFGGLFIHSPINGLAGIEWLYVYVRFGLEKKRHLTIAPLPPDAMLPGGQLPVFRASITSLTPQLLDTPTQLQKQEQLS